MTRTTSAAVGALASVTAIASAQPTPQPFTGELAPAAPVRIARAACGPDGPRMVGDWMPYEGSVGRSDARMVFDCIEPTGDCPDHYFYRGTGYCNMFYTNDMTVAPGTVIEDGARRADLAWFWCADGEGTSETCIVGVFTQDSAPCDSDSFDYSGWLIDYGTLKHGAWYSNVDITDGAWALPTGGSGSYLMYFLQEVTSSGAWVLATCSQPFLWATGEDRGDPDAPGAQGPLQLDDSGSPDGSHNTSSECFTYEISECPYELGAAAAFWGYRQDPCLETFPNCDGNTAVNTQDFLCFLGKWSAAFQSGNYDPGADCDGNSTIDTQDFLCFLGKFAACFG